MKMRCADARRQLSAKLDGELNAAVRASLDSHLGSCRGCRAAYAQLEAMHGLFGRATRYDARSGLAGRVAAAARPSGADWQRRLPQTLRLAAQAMALTAVIAIGAISGNVLATGSARGRAATPSGMFSLDLFAAVPPDSPGGGYLALTEAAHE